MGKYIKGETILPEVVSFGFKHGLPEDLDLLFDVRFLPNPYYDENLKRFSGKNKRVSDYVLDNDEGAEFLAKLLDILMFMLPLFEKKGREKITIGIGCTGGKHRSVAVTEYVGNFLKSKNYHTKITHRDLEKGL